MPTFFAAPAGTVGTFSRTTMGIGSVGSVGTGVGGVSFVGIFGWFIAVVVVVTVILLFVHFTLRPVFRLVPGGKGIIPIPGFSDGQVYWKPKTAVAPLIESKLPASYPTQNWTFTLDIFINNPTVHGFEPSYIFSRGTGYKKGTIEENVVEVLLIPGSNDLVVTVRNSLRNSESVLLSNVPVQTPFRLGVVVLDVAMEVYVNGRLMKTRAMDAPPANFKGVFVPPQGDAASLVKISNLHLWNRVLTPSEIRNAQPALVSSSLFKDFKLTGAVGSCMADIEKSVQQDIPTSLTTDLSNIQQQVTQGTSSLSSLSSTSLSTDLSNAQKQLSQSTSSISSSLSSFLPTSL